MSQQIVELDDQGKEIVAGQILLFSQHLQVLLEGMRTRLDRRQPQGGRLSLDGMRLAEERIELLTKHPLVSGRLAQHRVDHFHGGIRVVQERCELRGIDVQDAEERIDLRL